MTRFNDPEELTEKWRVHGERLAELGAEMCRSIVEAFAAEGLAARCTGEPSELVSSCSISAVHFAHDEALALDGPHVVLDPACCDAVLSQKALQLALLLEDVYSLFGSCALGVAHSNADLERLSDACRATARRIRPYP